MMDALVDKLDDDATQSFLIVSTSHSKITEFRKQLKIQAIKAAKRQGRLPGRVNWRKTRCGNFC